MSTSATPLELELLAELNQLRHERDLRSRRLALLTEQVHLVRQTVMFEGANPEHHRRTMMRHRAEWPLLWSALDELLR